MLRKASAVRDVAWIAERVRPRLAWDSYRLGSALLPFAPRVGIVMLGRAVDLPFTAEDEQAMPPAALPAQDRNAARILRDGAKHKLMRAYLESARRHAPRRCSRS